MRGKKTAALVLFFFFGAHDVATAQGGPPLLTDDPDTPGPGYWEINLATIVERSNASRRLQTPLVDLNYGVGERIQLKLEMPWLDARDTGRPSSSGLVAPTMGVKWRFLGQEGERVAWSTYPQLDIDAKMGFLPTEMTLEVGDVEINGEIGKLIAADGGGGWRYGLSTEFGLHSGLELLGELHGEQTGTSPTELVLELGGRRKLTSQIVLLLAAGTAVSGSPAERLRVRVYAGLQLNLPGQYVFPRRAHHHVLPQRDKGS
jgi:hypothetical protein